jgi:hypothetical protein
VIAEPPLLVGAVHVRATCVFPAVPVIAVGAPGTPTGVTPLEALEKLPVPTALIAATWKKYVVPLVRPVAVHAVVVEVVVQPAALLNGPVALAATCT